MLWCHARAVECSENDHRSSLELASRLTWYATCGSVVYSLFASRPKRKTCKVQSLNNARLTCKVQSLNNARLARKISEQANHYTRDGNEEPITVLLIRHYPEVYSHITENNCMFIIFVSLLFESYYFLLIIYNPSIKINSHPFITLFIFNIHPCVIKCRMK